MILSCYWTKTLLTHLHLNNLYNYSKINLPVYVVFSNRRFTKIIINQALRNKNCSHKRGIKYDESTYD